MEAEIVQNLNEIILSTETNSNLVANDNNPPTGQNLDILVKIYINIAFLL